MVALNEKALVAACQRGERQAFDELISTYYPYVSHFLLRMTGDDYLAEDLTQETFLKMIRAIDRYDPNGSAAFGTWLVTIAKNACVDHIRRNRVELADIDELPLADGTDLAFLVEKKLEYAEVLKALETLPPEQGLAIRLKYEEELTLEEIAQRFGVPAKTVKSRIHEGTVKLRKLLNKNERKDHDGN